MPLGAKSFLFLVIATASVAQTATDLTAMLASFVNLAGQEESPRKDRKTRFTSTDGTFYFEYPTSFARCGRNPNQPDRWGPDESCEAFIPVCSDYSGQSDGTVTCIAYPAERMKGTHFQAAAFSVSELKAATTAECLRVGEPPPHVGSVHKETVNGVTFTVTETDGVETGNLMDGYVYRSFHREKCYELDIRIAYSNHVYADPGTRKNFDVEVVHHPLKQVLDTFKFVK
jgi:hypothetical protein